MKHASDEAGCELHPNKGASLRLPVFHMGFNGITRMFQSSILVGHWSTRSVNHDLHSILQSLKNSHFSNFKLRSSTKVQTLTVKGHVSISISWLGKLVPRLLHQALADYKFSSPNIVESKSKAILPLGLSQLARRFSTLLPQQLRRAGRQEVLASSSWEKDKDFYLHVGRGKPLLEPSRPHHLVFHMPLAMQNIRLFCTHLQMPGGTLRTHLQVWT